MIDKNKKNLAVVILAAGKGERMKSQLPKVLHPICGRPLFEYVQDLVISLKPDIAVAVLGYKYNEVSSYVRPPIKIAIQKRLLGTADAVKEALPFLRDFNGTLLVLYADNPLLKKDTLNKLLRYHIKNRLDATLLTAYLPQPSGYGRILRDKRFCICGIVEEKDANDFQKTIKEVNTGVVCFDKEKLQRCLKYIKPNNRKKEFYLTDIIGIFYKKSFLIDSVRLSDIEEALGVNSRKELSQANRIMQRRINEKFMQQGVTIVDPESTFISYGTQIGKDSIIYPFTVIERDVRIGRHCSIGPFTHLREGSRLADSVVVGNFFESVRSFFGRNSRARHFSYIGDTRIGKGVNIGAGTVTANFDGKNKNKTIIKDGAFIGSDTVLVAPVRVGKNAKTGAGSVILKNRNVSDNQVVAGVPARPLKVDKMRL